jgi:hypothetical protein
MKLCLIALLVSFYGILVSAHTCRQVFEKSSLALNNPTAAQSLNEYVQPNSRDLSEYNDITGMKSKTARSLLNLVPEGGVAIDIGGGQGRAFHEMAEKADITAIVINTQEPSTANFTKRPLKGKFIYRKGWAQEVLGDYAGKADLITDIWGAFSYEMNKAEILDLIYTALKPGGRAYILYHPFKTRAVVKLPARMPVDIDRWLKETYPGIFSWYPSRGEDTSSAEIIAIKKPINGSGPESVGLRMTKGKLIARPSSDGSPPKKLPYSEFKPIAP